MAIDYVATDVELISIADAIRAKGGTSAALTFPAEFVNAISAIVTVNNQAKSGIVPSTSSQTITADSGYTGLSSVQVNGDSDLVAANIKKNVEIFGVTGTFTTTPSGKTALTAAALRSGYAGFINGSQVNGSMADTTVTEGTTTVSGSSAARGTWSQTAGYTASRTLDIVSFTNTGVNGHNYVDISSTNDAPVLVSGDYLYINKGWTDDLKISLARLVPDGSDVKGHGDYLLSGHSAYDNDGTLVAGTIPTKTASNLSASGKTVTVPSGYYAQQYTKDVAVGSATTPDTSITANPTISVSSSGLITASVSKTQSVTPTVVAGYVASGTAGNVTVSGSNTSQLTVQAAQTITPTTSDQTIASGKYLTGTQTIKGDANLIASNIKKDVTIFGVTGTCDSGAVVSETSDSHGGTVVTITSTSQYMQQEKTVTPSGSQQTVTPDSGYDGLSQVIVNGVDIRLGLGAEYVQDLGSFSWTLNDTTFDPATEYTGATTVKAVSNLNTFNADFSNYFYTVKWFYRIEMAYDSGAPDVAKPNYHLYTVYQYIRKYPSNRDNVLSNNYNTNGAVNYGIDIIDYYNASSVRTVTYGINYGIYLNTSALSYSHTTSNTPTITIRNPTVAVRNNTTYFSTNVSSKVNKANTKITGTAVLYRIPRNVSGNFGAAIYEDLYNYYRLEESGT